MRRLFICVWVVLLAFTAMEARSIKKIKKDALTVGVRSTNYPFGIMDGNDKGIEYAIISEIAAQMETRFRLVPIGSLRQGQQMLKSNKIDLIISSVKKSPKMETSFAVSNPYYVFGQGIMVLETNRDIFTFTDLNGKYVASTPESGAEKLIESFVPKAKLEMVSTSEDAVSLLMKGDVEAIINDQPILLYQALRSRGVRVLEMALTKEQYVVLANPNSDDLVRFVNQAIDSLRTSSGAEPSHFRKLLAKYKLPMTIDEIRSAGASSGNAASTASQSIQDVPATLQRIQHSLDSLQNVVRQLQKQIQNKR